jgi:hypothetical protein
LVDNLFVCMRYNDAQEPSIVWSRWVRNVSPMNRGIPCPKNLVVWHMVGSRSDDVKPLDTSLAGTCVQLAILFLYLQIPHNPCQHSPDLVVNEEAPSSAVFVCVCGSTLDCLVLCFELPGCICRHA